jgi:hypothetical protein
MATTMKMGRAREGSWRSTRRRRRRRGGGGRRRRWVIISVTL